MTSDEQKHNHGSSSARPRSRRQSRSRAKNQSGNRQNSSQPAEQTAQSRHSPSADNPAAESSSNTSAKLSSGSASDERRSSGQRSRGRRKRGGKSSQASSTQPQQTEHPSSTSRDKHPGPPHARQSHNKKSSNQKSKQNQGQSDTKQGKHGGRQANRSSRSKAAPSRQASSSGQRRAVPVRKPGETYRMVFAEETHYTTASVAVGERLTDFFIEEEQASDYGKAGNIYRGVVSRVLPSLNAAFVNIDLEKDGFLSFYDLGPILRRLNKHAKNISDALKTGDKVLVQLAKESIGEKGPSLTGKISIPGRFLVFMPYADVIRMSRQLEDKEKKRFRQLVEKQLDMEGGWIFRTASVGQDTEDIQSDIDYLENIWKQIQRGYEAGDDSKLLHAELKVVERALRDHFRNEMDEILVDRPRLKKRVNEFLNQIAPRVDTSKRVKLRRSKEQTVWASCGLEHDIDQLFSNHIVMESGGFIIIEEMETLTAIDVNTGKNIKGKSLDETIVETNLEAVYEVARQLRLRQIGGIIIIDFIDMTSKKDQDRVFQALLEELEQDRVASDIQQFTDLGLIQITRQRLGQSLTKRLTYQCPHCHGSGRRPLIALT